MPRKTTSDAKPPRRPSRRKAELHTESAPLDREEIARLAHLYWLERGGEGGSAEDDWYRAEQELRARQPAAKEKPKTVRRRAAT